MELIINQPLFQLLGVGPTLGERECILLNIIISTLHVVNIIILEVRLILIGNIIYASFLKYNVCRFRFRYVPILYHRTSYQ